MVTHDCRACSGEGRDPENKDRNCSYCRGTGRGSLADRLTRLADIQPFQNPATGTPMLLRRTSKGLVVVIDPVAYDEADAGDHEDARRMSAEVASLNDMREAVRHLERSWGASF
jgi:hypothetical protein